MKRYLLHLFYKEWIKTRWAFLGMLLLGIASILYIFTAVENKITLLGAKTILLRILYDEPPVIYYASFRYIPLLTALAIGISQYVPEITQKRIRLTLHLPVKNNVLIGGMAGFGLILLTLGNLLYAGLFLYYNIRLFPAEITRPVMISLTPWLLSGYIVYNFIAMIAMEPGKWRKVVYSVIAWYILQFFLVGDNPHGAFGASTPVMALMVVLSSVLVLYASQRFYKGER
ncbi:MAG: hypothetical protein K2L23_09465 [Odoribacter sp.]|nr:hypothetical protein [Odoribacter sp.]